MRLNPVQAMLLCAILCGAFWAVVLLAVIP